MNPCKWMSDDGQDICCNGECAVCAEFCPLANYPTICVYYEPIEQAKQALAALDAELVNHNKIPQVTYIFRAKNFFDKEDKK